MSAYGPSPPEPRPVEEPVGEDSGPNLASAEEKHSDKLCPPNIDMEVGQALDSDKQTGEITDPPVLEKGEGDGPPASSLPSTVPSTDGPATSDPITTPGVQEAETKAKGEGGVEVIMETDGPTQSVSAEGCYR